jgi:hypothetical protein
MNPWRRWEDNIKIDIKEIGFEVEVWTELFKDSVQWWIL